MSRSKTLDRVADLFANREDLPSRNAAFEAYRSPAFMESVRLHRHLRALADALVTLNRIEDAPLAVSKDSAGRWEFSYTLEQTRRQTFVHDDELRVLFIDPEVAAALRALGVHPPAPTSTD